MIASAILATALVMRDPDGRIHRSHKAIAEFKLEHPCPGTGSSKGSCRGFIVDHVIPLCYGGLDDKSNMQWQTLTASKIKDRIEDKLCRKQLTLEEYQRIIRSIN